MLGKWIREERDRRGWSQNELARLAGLSPAAVSQIETGRRPRPNQDSINRIADAFEMEVAAMYRAAYADPVETLEHLRTEGVPPDVLAELEQAAPRLSATQWAIIVAVARDMAGREPERRPRRVKGPIAPAESQGNPGAN